MSDLQKLDQELNQMLLSGKTMEAFEKYYAEDVVMQENSEPPRIGKAVNRKFEQEFFATVETVHGMQLLSSGAGTEKAYSEWELDITFKNGSRAKMSQIAVRQWKHGKVAHERFYYSRG